MKNFCKQMTNGLSARRMRGVTLLEVVLAIAIFAFGMLALMQLQGNLTRASSDANQRTVATNIGEELIEDIRAFEKVQVIAGNGAWEYLELTGTAVDQTVPRGGLNYQVTAIVTDFWWDADNDTFLQTAATNPPTVPEGLSDAYADHKLLRINVAWDSSQDFYVDDDTVQTLGIGSITLTEIIPSSPPILGAKIASDINAFGGGPKVDYTPGDRPDIIRLALPNERFKESSTPEPDVIRENEAVETWFDVITYNKVEDATFLRREEFLVVTCECELQSPGMAALEPTTWNGYGYTEGQPNPAKAYGVEPVSAQQSTYCDVCCRDHHDVPGETDADFLYRPLTGAEHAHFGYDKKGLMSPAGFGDTYVEACRMVRNDGFMRVAQDLEQAGFYGFPEGYLESVAGAEEYGAFVVTAATDYYDAKQKQAMAQPTFIPASTEDTRTNLPTVPSETKPLSTDYQQLRSRGVYLDYLTSAAASNIEKCFDGSGCINPAVNPSDGDTAALMYPFFDVQLTWLARWNPADEFLIEPVSVSNEPLASDNAHSRGYAELTGVRTGPSEIITTAHNGNLGLAGTGAIDPDHADNTVNRTIFMTASLDTVPHPSSGTIFTGMLSTEVNKVKTSDFVLTPSERVFCGQTDIEYTCLVADDAVNPTVELTNYVTNQALYGCSDNIAVADTTDTSTVFSLDTADAKPSNIADIWVQKTPCVQVAP